LWDNEVYRVSRTSIECARQRRSYLVFEARDAGRLTAFEDRRMWRLLLARLHPDAGGDHDLFAFACAIRDEMSGGNRTLRNTASEDGAEGQAAPFLRTWQEAMGQWSSSNRDAMNNLWKS
jgi:hypothetical protein